MDRGSRRRSRWCEVFAERTHYHLCAFHAQQAAEKALKGILRFHGRIPWGHNCFDLLFMTGQVAPRSYLPQIEQFSDRIVRRFQPDCIILHGSTARGTNHPYSDIDIVVIGGQLPEAFLERLYSLSRLRDGNAPIEVIGYTRSEWEQMMERLHLTVLEALQWGVSLYGESLFEQWKARLEAWKSMGLRRGETSWIIPPDLDRS